MWGLKDAVVVVGRRLRLISAQEKRSQSPVYFGVVQNPVVLSLGVIGVPPWPGGHTNGVKPATAGAALCRHFAEALHVCLVGPAYSRRQAPASAVLGELGHASTQLVAAASWVQLHCYKKKMSRLFLISWGMLWGPFGW